VGVGKNLIQLCLGFGSFSCKNLLSCPDNLVDLPRHLRFVFLVILFHFCCSLVGIHIGVLTNWYQELLVLGRKNFMGTRFHAIAHPSVKFLVSVKKQVKEVLDLVAIWVAQQVHV
jgi:hypothetical protein